jgi:hypothetical protein
LPDLFYKKEEPDNSEEYLFFANSNSAAIFVAKNFPLSDERPVEIFGQKFAASNTEFAQNQYSSEFS